VLGVHFFLKMTNEGISNAGYNIL